MWEILLNGQLKKNRHESVLNNPQNSRECWVVEFFTGADSPSLHFSSRQFLGVFRDVCLPRH